MGDGTAVGEEIANLDPRVYATNAMGALQGTPGEPNIYRWSPEKHMTWSTLDCIHLNTKGYRLFTDAISDEIELQVLGLE